MNTKFNHQFIKICLISVGALICLLLGDIVIANPTNTQLNTEAEEETPQEISPEVREILCKRFLLNSNCQGGAEGTTGSDTSGSSTTETESTPLPTDSTIPGRLPGRPTTFPTNSTTPGSLPGRPTTFPPTH